MFIAQASACALGHAQPFDQQGKPRAIAPGHGGQINDGGAAAVDGIGSQGEQRSHRGEMQPSTDLRAVSLQNVEGGDLLLVAAIFASAAQ